MTDILTLTMNPALDVSTSTATVSDTHKLRCEAPRRHPGGGGINVARVLHRLGADCVAVFSAGGAEGQDLQLLLDAEGVHCVCIPIAQETRQSFSVRESSSGREFRFVMPGPTLSPAEWSACLERATSGQTPAPRYLVASGSLPPGVPIDFYAQLARRAKAQGTRLVLDTSGPALAAALDVGVYMVKPSLRELRELSGQPLTGEAQWRNAARALVDRGAADVVALSLGDQGALLASAQGCWRAPVLDVQVHSATGAGDSFVAGMVWALSRGDTPGEAFRHAVAAGSAAVLSEGTGLCRRDDVLRLHGAVVLTPI